MQKVQRGGKPSREELIEEYNEMIANAPKVKDKKLWDYINDFFIPMLRVAAGI